MAKFFSGLNLVLAIIMVFVSGSFLLDYYMNKSVEVSGKIMGFTYRPPMQTTSQQFIPAGKLIILKEKETTIQDDYIMSVIQEDGKVVKVILDKAQYEYYKNKKQINGIFKNKEVME